MRKSFLLLLLVLFPWALPASAYDDQLLQVYAKVAPRIVLMTGQMKKPGDFPIDLCIMHEMDELAIAQRLAEIIRSIYGENVRNHPLHIHLHPYGEQPRCEGASLLFLLDTESGIMQPVLKLARQKRLPTMTYHSRYLADGVMLSLHLGKSVRPYLNIRAAKRNGIELDPLLVKISKLYFEERGE